MVMAIFIGRLLGLLRDTVLVSRFGMGLDADAFKIAVSVPDTIFMLVAGGGLSSAFIPVFGDFYYKNKKKEAWDAFGVVVTLCSLAAVVLITVAWIFSTPIVRFMSAGHKDDRVIAPAVYMSHILLPAQFAFLIGSVMIATLYVRKKFWVGALAPNIYNLCMVVGGAFLPVFAHLGIESMAWGALAGAIVGNLFLPIGAMVSSNSRFTPSLNFKTPGVDRFFKLLLPVIFGFSLPSMVTLITNKFASAYGFDGANTVLSSANNLMQAPLGIFGQALALGVFPILAQYVATNRMDLYRTQVSKTLRTVLYLGIPSGALILALAPEIVGALYGLGKGAKYGGNQVAISECLSVYSFGIFAWCVQPVLMRGFFSLHKTFKPIMISTVTTVLFIVLGEIAIHTSNDIRLIPLATNVSVVVLAIALYIALEREVGKLDRGGIAATLLLCGLASIAGGLVSFGLSKLLHPSNEIGRVAVLLLLGAVGAWVYYGLTKLMNVPETDYVDRAMGKITRKFKGR